MYLLDTNILIHYLQKKAEAFPYINTEEKVSISIVSYIEILGRKGLSEHAIEELKIFLNSFLLVVLDASLAEKAAHFRRKGLKTADAIIVAAAWESRVPLITADRAFRKLKEIKVINPFSS